MKGVGGWLLLFIILQWLPLFGLVGRLGNMEELFSSSRIMFTGWAVLGIVAAMSLLYTGHTAPVVYVKLFLWVDILLGVMFAISYTSAAPSSSGQLVGAALRSIIWLVYFNKSKRVRATYYGSEPALSTQEVVKPASHASVKKPVLVALAVLFAAAAIGTAVLMRSSAPTPQGGSATNAGESIRKRVESMDAAVAASNDRFRSALNDLKGLGSSVNTTWEAERAIAAIEKLQDAQRQNERQLQDSVDFVAANKDELQAQGFTDLFDAAALLGPTYHAYRTELSDFLRSYQDMAAYLRDHAAAIQRGGTPEKKRYDVMFATYVNALKRQNKAYFDHVAFVKNYASEHPSVSKMLEGKLPEEGGSTPKPSPRQKPSPEKKPTPVDLEKYITPDEEPAPKPTLRSPKGDRP